MNKQIPNFLCDKYQLVAPLGEGSFSRVYLVHHKSLEVDRALKIIPKTASDPFVVLSEARLLKSLSHPGIPQIFDMEEDADAIYLIQEYVAGLSLEAFLLDQEFISLSFFFQLTLQLTDIYRYLHTCMGKPVLYQDLKPSHLFYSDGQLKLIDFGLAEQKDGQEIKHYGNERFSAPESRFCQPLTPAADVYTIGQFMKYLLSYVREPYSPTLSAILNKATQPLPTDRYETVALLSDAVNLEFSRLGQTHLPYKIAVVASHHGCGATHLSVSLCSTLTLMGYSSIYLECNDSHRMLSMQGNVPKVTERQGILSYKCFSGIPRYGPGVICAIPEKEITLYDCGTDHQAPELASADLILYLVSPALWMRDLPALPDLIARYPNRLKLICNPGLTKAMRYYAKAYAQPVHGFSYLSDPFLVTGETIAFAQELLHRKGRNLLCSIIQKGGRHRPA